MSVLIKHMAMPKGCIYANDNDQTEYCPLLNHDDVPFCQYIESEPEIAIGIDERPVYCPLFDVPEPCQDTIYRQDAIDAFGLSEKTRKYDGDHSGYDTRMLYEIQDVLEGLPSAPLYTPDEIQTMQDLEWAQLEKMYELGKEERKKGKWIGDKSYAHLQGLYEVYCCSECGWGVSYREKPILDEYNFCPNCGADMREGEQDESD